MIEKLDGQSFKVLVEKGLTVVDARQPEQFADGFIEGAISIPAGDNFISTFQTLVEGSDALLVANEDDIAVLANALRVAGVDNVEGYLEGGMETWKEMTDGKVDMFIMIEADEFAIDYQFDEFYLVDVRTKEDFDKDHIEDAHNIEVADLEPLLADLDNTGSYYIYGNNCAEGVTAGSLFKRNGFERVRVMCDTYEKLKTFGIPLYVQKKKSGTPNPSDN